MLKDNILNVHGIIFLQAQLKTLLRKMDNVCLKEGTQSMDEEIIINEDIPFYQVSVFGSACCKSWLLASRNSYIFSTFWVDSNGESHVLKIESHFLKVLKIEPLLRHDKCTMFMRSRQVCSDETQDSDETSLTIPFSVLI